MSTEKSANLKMIGAVLREHGFRRHGTAFVFNRIDAYGVVSIERPRWAPAGRHIVVVNAGVCSRLVRDAEERLLGIPSMARPSIADCQWTLTLAANGLGAGGDVEWALDEEGDQAAGTLGMSLLLAHLRKDVVNWIRHYASDVSLRNHWAAMRPWEEDLGRTGLRYLIVLLEACGPLELLGEARETLEHLSRDATS